MITISNLDFSYGRRGTLFAGLDLSIAPGHIYGLLGKNGAGKTTLLNLMAGLLAPCGGSIGVNGYDPSRRRVGFLQEVFVVPEEFYVPEVSPRQYASLYAGFYPRFSDADFASYLKELEVDPQHRMHKMSMGQRKKAFIAFALACNTKILLMDEPTNGLDIPSKTTFRRLIAAAASDERVILISTHQVRDLENLIDGVIVLDDRRILFNRTVEEIADRLHFCQYSGDDRPAGMLYDEPGVLGGGKALAPNTGGQPSRIDMELLFNAVVNGKDRIGEVFTNMNDSDYGK